MTCWKFILRRLRVLENLWDDPVYFWCYVCDIWRKLKFGYQWINISFGGYLYNLNKFWDPCGSFSLKWIYYIKIILSFAHVFPMIMSFPSALFRSQALSFSLSFPSSFFFPFPLLPLLFLPFPLALFLLLFFPFLSRPLYLSLPQFCFFTTHITSKQWYFS